MKRDKQGFRDLETTEINNYCCEDKAVEQIELVEAIHLRIKRA